MKGEEERTSLTGFKDGADDQFSEQQRGAGQEGREGEKWTVVDHGSSRPLRDSPDDSPREFLRRYTAELLNVAVYIRIDARDAFSRF